jgi:hypothetical protein
MPHDLWRLSPHVCRRCFGRVLEGDGVFRCSVCGAVAAGKVELMCACGLTVAQPSGNRVRAFRCITNPAPCPASPAEVVIVPLDAPMASA